MRYCPIIGGKHKLKEGNVKGYYTCEKCRKFFYIAETNFPDVTEGMPLNAIKEKDKAET